MTVRHRLRWGVPNWEPPALGHAPTFGARPVSMQWRQAMTPHRDRAHERPDPQQFAGGRGVMVRADSPGRFAPLDVVARARSRLGEDRYRIASNNCEHFCHWCRSGENRSAQVERLLGWVSAAIAAWGRAAHAVGGAGLRLRTASGRC